MSVYWPGLNNDIWNMRYTCHTCNEIAPKKQKEPLILTPPSQYPFQQICADYFEITVHHYLMVVDRFSGWLNIYYYPTHKAIADTLISSCRTIILAMKSLKKWAHWISSAEYPQSNGTAELGVKTAKRIIHDNVSSSGTIDNDKVAKVLLQYINTPLPEIQLSPAQLLLHGILLDYLPMMMISQTAAATASYPKYHKNRILLPNVFCSKFYIKDTQSQ